MHIYHTDTPPQQGAWVLAQLSESLHILRELYTLWIISLQQNRVNSFLRIGSIVKYRSIVKYKAKLRYLKTSVKVEDDKSWDWCFIHIPPFQHMMWHWLENQRVWAIQHKLNTTFINTAQSLNIAQLWHVTHHIIYPIQRSVFPFSIRCSQTLKVCLYFCLTHQCIYLKGGGEWKWMWERGRKCTLRQAWQEMYLWRKTLNDYPELRLGT